MLLLLLLLDQEFVLLSMLLALRHLVLALLVPLVDRSQLLLAVRLLADPW